MIPSPSHSKKNWSFAFIYLHHWFYLSFQGQLCEKKVDAIPEAYANIPELGIVMRSRVPVLDKLRQERWQYKHKDMTARWLIYLFMQLKIFLEQLLCCLQYSEHNLSHWPSKSELWWYRMLLWNIILRYLCCGTFISMMQRYISFFFVAFV